MKNVLLPIVVTAVCALVEVCPAGSGVILGDGSHDVTFSLSESGSDFAGTETISGNLDVELFGGLSDGARFCDFASTLSSDLSLRLSIEALGAAGFGYPLIGTFELTGLDFVVNGRQMDIADVTFDADTTNIDKFADAADFIDPKISFSATSVTVQFGFAASGLAGDQPDVYVNLALAPPDGCSFAVNSFSSSTDGNPSEDFTIASYEIGSTDYIDIRDDGMPGFYHIAVNSGPSDREGFDVDLVLDYSAYDLVFFLDGRDGPGIHRVTLADVEVDGSITDVAIKTSDGSSIGEITTDGNSIVWETTVADVLQAIGGGRDLPITIQWASTKVFTINSFTSVTDGDPDEDIMIASYELGSTDYIDIRDDGMPWVLHIAVNSGPSDREGFDVDLVLDYSAYEIGFFFEGRDSPGIHRVTLTDVEVDGSITDVAIKTSAGSSIGETTTDGNSIVWETTVEDVLQAIGENENLPITIQWATCGASCAEDLDGNGQVGFADLTQILGAWGPCPGCPADLDGNGQVGFSDLTQLLSNWGPCS